MAKIIDSVPLPSGLRELSEPELEAVVTELRDELIDSVATTGGHFASSLGAAEITVVLHHLFETPQDKLVWDTGHQTYIHKMLTGRRDRLKSIRQKGGLSGFLRRSESEFDTFGAGHAGTSVSAAVGMATALQKSDPERHVVAVIGDGSLTSGMVFEALNHAGALGLKNLIVVLNDNEMSISPNVGAISWLFSKTVTSRASTIARSGIKAMVEKGYVPRFVYRALDRAEEATQGFFATPSMLFEAFGFRYIGPVNGHSVTDLKTALVNAKRQDVPVLVHAVTAKGYGYEPAEWDPLKWHATTPFDRKQGEVISVSPAKVTPPAYTKVFSNALIAEAKADPKVVAITAAMPTGTGLDAFDRELPQQFFDVGICEQHAVTFAAGLACEGFKPICAIYSTFLQRAFDQVLHDVCIQNLPVIFALDRGGLVGNDGETHQGLFDIGYLRLIPNMTVMAPKDEAELVEMLHTAIMHNGPIALRFPRDNGIGCQIPSQPQALPIGKAEVLVQGSEILIIALGTCVQTALAVGKLLNSGIGIEPTVVNARFAKPLDKDLLAELAPSHQLVCTIEDHALSTGFGSAVLECLSDNGIELQNDLLRFGVPDRFISHASRSEQLTECGLDADSIQRAILNRVEQLNLPHGQTSIAKLSNRVAV